MAQQIIFNLTNIEQNGTSAIHMVSAFATGARLVLAQQKVPDKSNEITAIPLLLNLLSLKKAQLIAGAVRSHWMVENNLHWTLDVVFNDDLSRVHKEHAGENMAIVRHIVLNMLNQAKSTFPSIAKG